SDRDCALSRVLINHQCNQRVNQPCLDGCPLCKKQEILREIHLGKGPRSVEEEEEDKNETRNDAEDEEGKVTRTPTQEGHARRILRPITATTKNQNRTRLQQMIQSNKCRKSQCSMSFCAITKSLLRHTRTCPPLFVCNYAGCKVARDLLNHYRSCNPVLKQCEICGNQPLPA
ncbi:hypothetical protein PENTCL1PPCAC_9968, partial [Pristionchus entomophagus]